MKCLSLWQPWASVIFELDSDGVQLKPDETRPWKTNIRGTIAIHAAKKTLPLEESRRYWMQLNALGLSYGTLPFGAIIGTVELVDCRPTLDAVKMRKEWQLFWGDYRDVGDDGKSRWAWELRNPVRFTKPIPCVGRQGFFEVRI